AVRRRRDRPRAHVDLLGASGGASDGLDDGAAAAHRAGAATHAEVTLIVTGIVGDAEDRRYEGRRVESLVISAADASRPRLRLSTNAGTDVALQLERGTFLRDGAVVHDDGDLIVVVERARERVMVVELDPSLARGDAVRHAALVAHAFGNQHVP